MGDATGLWTTAPPDLNQALLDGKTTLPAPRRDAVSRRDLIERARESGCRIVAVTAPAGYGKSTMLAEWTTLEDRPLAWASIDRLDDDPAALLSLLATATADLGADGDRVIAEMRGVGTSMLGRSAPMLAHSWSGAAEPFVLFIDDLHLAASTDCRDALEIVLSGVPEGSQVVIGSRRGHDFLARLRAEGRVFDVTEEHLRIDATGARTIFAAADVDAAEEDVASAVERCEGWPTGIFLCALAAADGADLDIVGDDRLVADYLYRECLAGLEPGLQQFLRETAILDQLSGPLCDAVRDAGDSHEMLRMLDDLNLFLVPLDRRRRWFRYHALFREFLLAELEHRDPPAVARGHLRAADWFEGQGAPQRALEHLLTAGDRTRSPLLVGELALPTYQRGEVAVVARWLADLGDATVEAFPPLVVIAAWVSILLGISPASERWAATLERLDVHDPPTVERGGIDSDRSMIRAAMCVDGPERALADAQYAVQHEPEWSPWRPQALHLLGSAIRLVGGAEEDAAAAFREAIRCAPLVGDPDSVVLSEAELAILAIGRGDWATADRHAAASRRAIDDNHLEGYGTTALGLAVSARIAIRNGERDAAPRLLARAMRTRVGTTHVLPFFAMRTRLQLALCYAELSDNAAALQLLGEIDDLLRLRPRVGTLVDEIEAFRAQVTGNPGRVSSVPLTPAELRVLPYLQTHLTIAEIGERLFLSRSTVSSQTTSIYRKLGARTRSQAVARAMERGLLGE
ncbi:LuxR C-terminal-related transcriptional regulator [Microbacterium sp. AZCO]|uniref:helix-turn-helix transcriptional regulator n=1 Tax=Microbacterium sp. AZCO TaxID=3142976 RepID=UPI0031F38B06